MRRDATPPRSFLDRDGVDVEWLSASSAVTTGLPRTALADEANWPVLLEIELEASRSEGYLDAGTHLIAAVRRR